MPKPKTIKAWAVICVEDGTLDWTNDEHYEIYGNRPAAEKSLSYCESGKAKIIPCLITLNPKVNKVNKRK